MAQRAAQRQHTAVPKVYDMLHSTAAVDPAKTQGRSPNNAHSGAATTTPAPSLHACVTAHRPDTPQLCFSSNFQTTATGRATAVAALDRRQAGQDLPALECR